MSKRLTDKMLKVFTDTNNTEILFLESDYGLYHAVGNLEKFLVENKRKYNILACINELPLKYILDQIEWYDIIVFQTTWVRKVSHQLVKKLFTHKFQSPKIIVECCTAKPTWYHIPEDLPMNHEFYVFEDSGGYTDYMKDWEFYKLKKAP